MQLPLERGLGGFLQNDRRDFSRVLKHIVIKKNEPDFFKSGSFFTSPKSRYPFDFFKVRLSLFKKSITPFLGFFGHVC